MPRRLTFKDNATGRDVSFDWNAEGDPTEADLDEIFAEAGKKIPDGAGRERDWTDTALDLLPLAGGIAGGIAGAPTGPGAIGTAALGGAGGHAVKRIIEGLIGRSDLSGTTPLSAAKELGTAGAEQGAGQALGMGAAAGLAKLGRTAARGALGAQAGIRNRFPTVDLERVAIREGMPNAAKASALSTEANAALKTAATAADSGGAARIQPREMVKKLRPLYDRATTARMGEDAQQIAAAANNIRNAYRGGQPVRDALVTKQEWQALGKGVLQGAADPRSASTGKKVAGAVSRGTAEAVGKRPGMAKALTRSQELMALDKAMKAAGNRTPILRNLLIGTTLGGGAGYAGEGTPGALKGAAAGYALTNPRSLALIAKLLSAGAPAGREATRGLADFLIPSHEPENEQ